MTAPRVLTIMDGRLHQEPCREIRGLRQGTGLFQRMVSVTPVRDEDDDDDDDEEEDERTRDTSSSPWSAQRARLRNQSRVVSPSAPGESNAMAELDADDDDDDGGGGGDDGEVKGTTPAVSERSAKSHDRGRGRGPKGSIESRGLHPLTGMSGRSLDIEVVIQRGQSQRAGIHLEAYDGLHGEATIMVDWEKALLEVVIAPGKGKNGDIIPERIVSGPVELDRDDTLSTSTLAKMRILLDHSCVEVYMGSGEVLSTRIYRGGEQSGGVVVSLPPAAMYSCEAKENHRLGLVDDLDPLTTAFASTSLRTEEEMTHTQPVSSASLDSQENSRERGEEEEQETEAAAEEEEEAEEDRRRKGKKETAKVSLIAYGDGPALFVKVEAWEMKDIWSTMAAPLPKMKRTAATGVPPLSTGFPAAAAAAAAAGGGGGGGGGGGPQVSSPTTSSAPPTRVW